MIAELAEGVNSFQAKHAYLEKTLLAEVHTEQYILAKGVVLLRESGYDKHTTSRKLGSLE